MAKRPRTQWRTWTAQLAALCIVFMLAVSSNAGSGPYYVGNPEAGKEQVDPKNKQTRTLDQLAELLNLTGDQKKDLQAGCVGVTAALQGQAPIPTTVNGQPINAVRFPEGIAGTTQYATKAAADAAAAAAPAGSTVVEFQKQGGPLDANGNPTSVAGGPYDYTTVINVGGTIYYVDANHADIPPGSARFYVTTTPPKEPTATDPNGAYTASKWYVTIIPPQGGVPGPGSTVQK